MEPIKYKDMLAAAADQIQQRAGLLSKRVFLVTWPFLVLVGIDALGLSIPSEKIPPSLALSFWVVFIIFAAAYGLVMGLIFSMEKRIWIDSYFDGRNLTPEESWRIARRLLSPMLKIIGATFLRYFMLPLLSVIAGIVFIFAPFWNYLALNGSDAHAVLALIGVGLVAVVPLAFTYVISVKIRFLPFLFLDTYGSGISTQDLFAELKKLNSVATSDSVTKTIVADFGAATVSGLSTVLIGSLESHVTSQLDVGARVMGRVASAYTSSAASSMASLGREAAVYLLYRYARESFYQKPQEINEALYRLSLK
jgi:hypothetical protein